jgi:PKD repeat protein
VIHSTTASATNGDQGLVVQFTHFVSDADTASASLTLEWQFGDGTSAPITLGQTIYHTYNTFGVFDAVLYVSDTSVTVTSTPLVITIGEVPVVTITSPADPTAPFRGGDVIELVGVAYSGGNALTGNSLQV